MMKTTDASLDDQLRRLRQQYEVIRLRKLAQLLDEAERPVPPAPPPLRRLVLLVAEAIDFHPAAESDRPAYRELEAL